MDAINSRGSLGTWRDDIPPEKITEKIRRGILAAIGRPMPAAIDLIPRANTTNLTDPRGFGIDVSNWNGEIDFGVVKQYVPEILFVSIRASVGGSYRDPRFEKNYQNAKRAGFLINAYHYFYPSVSVATQVSLFKSMLAGEIPDFGVSPDLETAQGLSNATVAQVSEKFVKDTEQAIAAKTIPYSRATYMDPIFNGAAWLKQYNWWLAHYLTSGLEKPDAPWIPKGVPSYLIHQTSSKGSIPGIESLDVDHDRFNGNKGAVLAYAGVNVPPAELTLEEKVNRLWMAHPELH